MAANILETWDASDVDGQVSEAIRRTTQRVVQPEEVRAGAEFIYRTRAREGADPQQALAKFCLLSLNLNEFIFLQ
jgi:hypothetical protein